MEVVHKTVDMAASLPDKLASLACARCKRRQMVAYVQYSSSLRTGGLRGGLRLFHSLSDGVELLYLLLYCLDQSLDLSYQCLAHGARIFLARV